MIELLRDGFSWGFILAGSAFVIIGCVGLVRFPDFYTRLHPAGVTDTAGAELILIGMALQAPTWLIAVKVGLIMAFLFLTSPVATHAIAHAAWVSRLAPMTGADLSYGDDELEEPDV
ncbi:MAG: monovalent cation/H(+) antiporter subunit G [Pseudomonadota bacterium]